MSQIDAIREMDADMHAAMVDAGLADHGHYTAPGANFDTPVRIYIDRAAQVLGEFGQVIGRRIEIGIMLADASPAKGGRVFVPEESATYEITKRADDADSDDGSMSRWVVRRV